MSDKKDFDTLLATIFNQWYKMDNIGVEENLTETDIGLHMHVNMVMCAAHEQIFNDPRYQTPIGVNWRADRGFNCHEIARGWYLHSSKLRFVDGYCLGVTEDSTNELGQKAISVTNMVHSWLVTPDGAIIDPKPIGFSSYGAILIPTKGKNIPCFSRVYIPEPDIIRKTRKKLPSKKLWRRARLFAELLKKGRESAGDRLDKWGREYSWN